MKALRRMWLRLAGALSGRSRDRELADELESHIQMLAEDNLRRGMSAEEALRQARLKFGGLEATKESYRDQRGLPQLESLAKDVRFALRIIWKSPGASALSIISIALGIGLTTGLFSIADSWRLRPLPIERADEVFTLNSRGDDGRFFLYGWPDYEDLAAAAKGIAEISAYTRRAALLAGEDGNQMVFAYAVTPNHFSFLGLKAALGRASLAPVEGRPAAVIGYRLWQQRFGGDPEVVGKTVVLNGKAFVVTAVMPPEYTGLVRGISNDIWVSAEAWFDVMGSRSERQDRDGQFEIAARLRPGVTPELAAARLDTAIRGPGKHKPSPRGSTSTFLAASFAMNWREQIIAGAILFAVLGFVLFTGCANAAQVRLAQGEARKKELAVRRALGAGSRRIARLLLVEAAIIGAAGASIGVALAHLLIGRAATVIAAGLPFVDFGMRLDARVLAITVAATLAAVLVAGLAPMRHALGFRVTDVLKSEQGVTGARTEWRKKTLMVVQIAASVLFFGVAVQFIASARNAAALRPGFDPTKRMFVMEVGKGWAWPTAIWAEQACQRLSAVSGVRAATFARRLPLSGSGGGAKVRVELPGRAPLGTGYNNVAGNYFRVMGVHVIAGRGIEPSDNAGSAPVVVVSRQLASQVFGARNPLGEWLPIDGRQRQVVGIVEDSPSNSLHETPAPFLYVPLAQKPSGDLTLLVETAGNPDGLARALRAELKRFDPGATVYSSSTLERHMEQAMVTDRLLAGIAVVLGIAGLLLSAAGLFGVIQYSVNRRTREMGIRMALGAPAGGIRDMVLAESLRLSACAVPIGLLLVWCAGRLTGSLLLGVSPLDPAAYVLSAALAAGLALAAAWLPAARAARMDPMAALRSE